MDATMAANGVANERMQSSHGWWRLLERRRIVSLSSNCPTPVRVINVCCVARALLVVVLLHGVSWCVSSFNYWDVMAHRVCGYAAIDYGTNDEWNDGLVNEPFQFGDSWWRR